MPGTLRSPTDRFLATLILHPFRRARQPEEMWGFGLPLLAASSRRKCLLARRLDARVSVLNREGCSGSDGCSGFPDVGEHPVVGRPGLLGEAATQGAWQAAREPADDRISAAMTGFVLPGKTPINLAFLVFHTLFTGSDPPSGVFCGTTGTGPRRGRDVGFPESRAAAAEGFTRRRGVLSFAATC
jgi:hypothetical protein